MKQFHKFVRQNLVFLLLCLSLLSCRSRQTIPLVNVPQAQSTPTTEDAIKVPTIALVMKTLTNPFFVEMERGARQAESEFGVHLLVQTAAQETSIAQQISIIERLIQDRVDAIIIAPGDSVELLPVLKRAQDAGIVIVNIDNRLDIKQSAQIGLTKVPFISVNNEHGAYLSAKFISSQVRQPTEAIILEGIRTARNAQDRKQGALKAFRENPNITVVANETANWKIDEAYEVTKKLFTSHPHIGAVFCANDMMALGTLKYLNETHRNDVLVAGFDALEEAKSAIQTGVLAATIDQQAAQQGYLGVQYAIRGLRGQELPAETMVDVKVVTRSSN
jgi:ribose transport system substrate-binding protein